jgi:hypothetical protein
MNQETLVVTVNLGQHQANKGKQKIFWLPRLTQPTRGLRYALTRR